jgi:glutathione S-transferase
VKLYDSLGPNPRLVRMFALEKGIDLPSVQIDIMAGENRKPEYLGVNPVGHLPALVLDDGSVLAETVPICEYLEERHPEPSLIGRTPEERATTRMWVRQAEQQITSHLVDGFRAAEGLPMFKERMHVIPHAADDFKACCQEGYAWLEGRIGDGRSHLVGERFSLADIVLYCLADFGTGVGQPINPECPSVLAWFERVGARDSAEASLHPVAKAGGMRA